MTFKEFLEFIGQSPNHFLGFLIVLGMSLSFIYNMTVIIFKKKKKEDNK
jgi:hypothetical protein